MSFKKPPDDDEVYYDYGEDFPRSASRPRYSRKDERDAAVARAKRKLATENATLTPVATKSRKIASTFWGAAWCRNLERYQDYESRLPRGRSYLRDGHVLDLKIAPGEIRAKVAGQELYDVVIKITPLAEDKADALVQVCAARIGSVLELLSGKLSDEVMAILTDPETGLFPDPGDIRFSCTCPDWANLCKHVASTLYGVAVVLDTEPARFFMLRGIDEKELVARSGEQLAAVATAGADEFDAGELSRLFGVDIVLDDPQEG